MELGEVPQFLTWRLADAVPAEIIRIWQNELAALDERERSKQLARRVERFADAGHGACLLGQPRPARLVQEALFHDDGRRYALHAWCVMPNHVHALLTPRAGERLAKIVQAIKGVSAKRLNDTIGEDGKRWQEDYFDRFIRDDAHFERVVRFIEWNPVKAGLCQDPRLFPWSSANPDAREARILEAGGRGVRRPVADQGSALPGATGAQRDRSPVAWQTAGTTG